MKARRLIESSGYDPDRVNLLGQAFDAAWLEISHHFDADDERARLQLAHAVLAVMRPGDLDAEDLKQRALRVMALGYRN